MKDKILYIDDEEYNLKGFVAVFKAAYEVFTALSTHDAELILKEQSIKVVLSDQKMPSESGLDFFKRIRNTFPHILFIIITGYADIDLVIKAINSGLVYQFILKPWQRENLLMAITKALELYELKIKNVELLTNLENKNQELESSIITLKKTTQELNTSKLQLKIRESALQHIIASTFGKSSYDYFKSMVLSLCQVLQAEYLFIGKLIPENKMETLALAHRQSIDTNRTFKLDNTPCESVVGKETKVFTGNIDKLFPVYASYWSNEIQGYLGTPVYSRKGIPLGVLAALFTGDMSDVEFKTSVFELFVANIGAEIERSLVEIELKESETKFRQFFNKSTDAIFIADIASGRIVDANERAAEIMEMPRQNIIGMLQKDLHPVENTNMSKRSFKQHVDDLIKGQSLHAFENFLLTKSNQLIPVEIKSALVKIQNKKYIMGIFRDVSERKKNEIKLKESEELLNIVFESAPYIIVLLNKNREIVKVNLPTKQLIKSDLPFSASVQAGYLLSCIALTKNPEQKQVHCSHCPLKKIINKALANGESVLKKEVEFDTYHQGMTVKKFFLISSKQIIKGGDKYILLTFDDISEQKKIKEALIETKEQASFNEKRYALLSDLTFEGILLHQNRQIIDANKSMQKLTGYTKAELMGTDVIEKLFPPEYHQFIEQKIEQEYSPPYEVMLKHKNGNMFPVEIEAKNFKIRNRKIRAASIRSLIDRKQTEKAILQAVIKTEEDQKTKFAQELHDGLGPVLSNIQMYFQWLAEDDENKALVLEKGLSSLKNAFSTLREISNNLSPHILHDFGLDKALNRFVERLPVSSHQKIWIDSTLEMTRFEPSVELALYRVLTELIHNTRKHAQAKTIRIHLNSTDHFVCVDYYDDGIGFNYEQVCTHSTGHGLVNMQNRIKTLSGEFVLNTSPNKGMHVYIKTPKYI